MKKLKLTIIGFVIVYLILMIPESEPDSIEVAGRAQFIWNRDEIWNKLERDFAAARESSCDSLSWQISDMLNEFSFILDSLERWKPDPDDKIFEKVLDAAFLSAPLIGACPDSSAGYIGLVTRMRQIVKEKSQNWNPHETSTQNTLYKLIYGGRAAVEEILLQSEGQNIPLLSRGQVVPAETPFAHFLGVKIHSGDILVSRGGAPTSALISRGSDYPGNFSHVALVYIDSQTNIPYIIEAHIEVGVAIASLEEYMSDKKLRVMVLRLRSDLDQLIDDPMLPHKAAKSAYERALNYHIPYDFEMDYANFDKLFCSEVVSSVYENLGINLWIRKSSISSIGTAKILAGFGVRYFETQEPSDLEYDTQLSVVAEWCDLETLFKDHVDNAVVDAILEWSEEGNEITTDWYLLPVFRGAKLYSIVLNQFEKAGPVPEGMSPSSALRHEAFKALHSDIKSFVLKKVSDFKNKYYYTPPYWRLLGFARDYFTTSAEL